MYISLFPEFIEIYVINAIASFIKASYDLLFALAACKFTMLFFAHHFCHLSKNVIIVSGFKKRLYNLSHRINIILRIRAAIAYIVSFERGCRGKHYIGHLCHRRPPRLMNYHRIKLADSIYKFICIWMMSQNGCARYIHDFDVWISYLRAFKFDLFARI